MRLIHRNRPADPPEEDDCDNRSYVEGVRGNVDIVSLEASEPPSDILPEADDAHHVTSEGLKRQFAERLAARRRRR